MKKKFYIIIAIVLTCILLICSCQNPNNSVSSDETSEETSQGGWTMDEREFFDTKNEHKPHNVDFQQIKSGMSFAEIVEIIGKPHGYGGNSNIAQFRWDTIEGKEYCIFIVCNDDFPQGQTYKLNDYYEYGVALNDPWTK